MTKVEINIIKRTCLIFSLLFLSSPLLFGQDTDSTLVAQDTTDNKNNTAVNHNTYADSNSTSASFILRNKPYLKKPTMPPLHISKGQKPFHIEVDNDFFKTSEEKTNWDALNMPTNRTDYEITREYLKPLIPITPLEVPPKDVLKPLSIHDYIIPTRQELDILEILWVKDNMMDTTIYSCLDTTLNITMEDLNHLLEKMNRKGIVHRKIVSPRNEFNAFGIMIEMSPQNRRNRVYAYKSNVDREMMRRFINANAYLFNEDSSIVNRKQLEAARHDSTLLRDLNTKIHLPKQ